MNPIRDPGFHVWGYIKASVYGALESTSRKITSLFRNAFVINEPTTNDGALKGGALKEFLRRVELCRKGMSDEKEKESIRICNSFAVTTNIKATLDSLVNAFRTQHWDDPVFQDPHFNHYAMMAYTEGLLTDAEYRILGSCVSYRLDIPERISNSDITCRLSGEQKSTLIATLESLPNVDQSIITFLIALNQGDWKAPIFDDENFPHYALLAYMQGLITIEQLGTIQTYWTLMQERGKDGIEVVRLFNADGSVNEEARKAIKQTCYQNHDWLNPKMDETQLDNFFRMVKNLPYSEQQFFVTPAKEEGKEPTVREVINGRSNLNLFSRFSNPLTYLPLQMDASIGMWEAAMQVCHKNPVKPQIVIGNSPPEDFFPSETRILSIAYPGVPQPSEADGHSASGTDFLYHDWYHIDFVSNIPPSERERMNEIVSYVKDKKLETKEQAYIDFLDTLYSLLLDREFLIYKQLPPNRELLSLCFWISVTHAVAGTFLNLEESSFKELLKKENKEKSCTFLKNLFEGMAKMPYDPSFDTRNYQKRSLDKIFLKSSVSTIMFSHHRDRTEAINELIGSIDPAEIIYQERGKVYTNRSSTNEYYTHEDGQQKEFKDLETFKKAMERRKDSQ